MQSASLQFSERHLGTVVLRVRSATVDIADLLPNPEQPRLGPKDDPILRKNIEDNGGLLEPILVEPHPHLKDKLQIVDGERRHNNCAILVNTEQKPDFRHVPVQITDRTLTKEERLRAWVIIHMQRKDWSVKEKEATAYALIDKVGRMKAASIMGISVREVDKLKDTFELSKRLEAIKNPDASITYAREIQSLPQYLRTPPAVDAIVKKVIAGKITSSKQIRELRHVLKDSNANATFLSEESTIDDAKKAMVGATPPPALGQYLATDLEIFRKYFEQYPWPQLLALKGNAEVVEKIRQIKKQLTDVEQVLTG